MLNKLVFGNKTFFNYFYTINKVILINNKNNQFKEL